MQRRDDQAEEIVGAKEAEGMTFACSILEASGGWMASVRRWNARQLLPEAWGQGNGSEERDGQAL